MQHTLTQYFITPPQKRKKLQLDVAIFKKFSKQLKWEIWRKSGRLQLNKQDKEDLMQDAYILLLSHLEEKPEDLSDFERNFILKFQNHVERFYRYRKREHLTDNIAYVAEKHYETEEPKQTIEKIILQIATSPQEVHIVKAVVEERIFSVGRSQKELSDRYCVSIYKIQDVEREIRKFIEYNP